MSLEEYQEWTRTVAIYPRATTGTFMPTNYCVDGLIGEAVDIANAWKKIIQHPNVSHAESEDFLNSLTIELGDVIWYAIRLADELHIPLDLIMRTNIEKLEERKRASGLVNFHHAGEPSNENSSKVAP